MKTSTLSLVLLLLAAIPGTALAQTPRPDASAAPAGENVTAPEAPDQTKLDEAKSLFRQGNELRKAGDCERASELYLRSRRLVASVPNTLNAAYCLSKIGRGDEALELYEELLTTFRDQLSDEQRRTIAPALGELRARVSSVDISSNTDGTVVIDGRTRGRLPLAFPVRVLPGKHQIRVLKDGFETFEQTVNVAAAQSLLIDAKLARLTVAGRLHVDTVPLVGGQLFVDGALVGVLPWEGALAPGAHLIAARGGDRGTAPRLVTVVFGQTVTTSLDDVSAVSDVRIVAEPSTANIEVAGVPVGRGGWQGWLPLGKQPIRATELGYVDAAIELDVAAGQRAQTMIRLLVDTTHPVWDARRAELAQHRAQVRSGDEIASLYINSVVLGMATGIWIDVIAETSDVRSSVLPIVLFGGAGVGMVALIDNRGRPLRYGVPEGAVTGMYIGLEQGLSWGFWHQARTTAGSELSTKEFTSILWGSMLVGTIGGGAIASRVGSTPGQASLVGSSALWGGLVSAMIASSATTDDGVRDDRIFLASAIGINAGIVGGALLASRAAPSTARSRFLDLGALAGGLTGAGLVALVQSNDIQSSVLTAGIAGGIVTGMAVSWAVTSKMPADRPEDPTAAASFRPTILPVQRGATLGLTGTF